MKEMSFRLVDHFDQDAPAISVDHMGDGMFVLTEALEDGHSERICLTVGQISELYARANLIYGAEDLPAAATG